MIYLFEGPAYCVKCGKNVTMRLSTCRKRALVPCCAKCEADVRECLLDGSAAWPEYYFGGWYKDSSDDRWRQLGNLRGWQNNK